MIKDITYTLHGTGCIIAAPETLTVDKKVDRIIRLINDTGKTLAIEVTCGRNAFEGSLAHRFIELAANGPAFPIPVKNVDIGIDNDDVLPVHFFVKVKGEEVFLCGHGPNHSDVVIEC